MMGNVGVFLETQYCHFIVSHRLKGFNLICSIEWWYLAWPGQKLYIYKMEGQPNSVMKIV